MDRYTLTYSSIWSDDEFYRLGHPERELYFYILNSPLNNIAGYYRLQPRQIAVDTKYEEKEILPMLTAQSKLWKYDLGTKQILIPNYLKYNKVSNANQFKGIKNAIKPLTICSLHIIFLNKIAKFSGVKSWNYLDKEMIAEVVSMAETCEDDESDRLINNYKYYISLLSDHNST